MNEAYHAKLAQATDHPSVTFAQLGLERAAATVTLLSILSAAPRNAVSIARNAGIDDETFSEADLFAIWLGLTWASNPLGPPKEKIAIASLMRRLLQSINCWDQDDPRSFVSGSTWHPGAIANLLTAVRPSRVTPEMIREAVAAIFTIRDKQIALQAAILRARAA